VGWGFGGGNLGVFGLGIGGGCGVGFGLGWGVGFGCGSKYIDQNFVFEETKVRKVKKELPQKHISTSMIQGLLKNVLPRPGKDVDQF